MITILCSPKPFLKEAAWNQINALRSWRAINPEVEIFIFGAVPGAKEAATEVYAKLVPEIETSSTGAPSFNAMVMHAFKYGRYDLQVYINCDILINASMAKAMQAGVNSFGRFLLVGERLDLKESTKIDTRDPDWMDNLVPLAENRQLNPHGPTGVDYFGFTRDTWGDLPPVYMGRGMCDQALLHYCLSRRIPVLDATLAVTAVHQFHDYSHIQGGKQEVFSGKDLATMTQLHKISRSLPTVTDANWSFSEKDSIVKGRQRWLRKGELVLRYRYRLHTLAMALRGMQYLGGKNKLQPSPPSINTILSSWKYFLGDHPNNSMGISDSK